MLRSAVKMPQDKRRPGDSSDRSRSLDPRVISLIVCFVAGLRSPFSYRRADDDLRSDAVHFAILESPQNVPRTVGAPAEVRASAMEVLLPVGRTRGIEPPPRDDGSRKVDVDGPLRRFLPQLAWGVIDFAYAWAARSA